MNDSAEAKRSPAPKRTMPATTSPPEGGYEQLYGMLLANLPFSLILIGRNMRVVSANRNFLEKGGRSEKDTIGGRMHEIFSSAIMEYTHLEAEVRNVFNTGQALQGTRMTYRAPGIPKRTYYYTVIPVKLGTAVKHAMIVMDDITEKLLLGEKARMAERHLASVVESATDLVVSTDAEGRIISSNAAAERISDYPLSDVRGSMLSELFATNQRNDVAVIIRQLAAGDVVSFRELNLVARSGALVPVDWSFSTIRDDAGEVGGIVAVGRDLSERRAFEKQIFESEKLAALGVMAGGIAHELRNPLSVSFSAAQFLQEKSRPRAFRQECVRKIIDGIRQASTIIENMLQFARPAPSGPGERANLVSLVHEAVALMMTQMKLGSIEVREDYEDPSVLISGNANLLQQVVMNLILNACQAMPAGGTLRIAVERQAAHAVLRVGDSGCGIPASNLKKVFDPFFTTRPVGKGTGLGLPICNTVVKQHGGTIGVESVEGEGSTFTVRLPLSADAG